MKVLYIPHDSQLFGGANYALLEMIKTLKEKYDVNPIVLVPSEGELTEKLKELNIEYIKFDYGWWAYTKSNNIVKNIYRNSKIILNEISQRYRIKGLCSIIKNKGIDLIHTNSSVVNIGALVSKETNIPHIWHVREFGEEHLNLRYLYGTKFSRIYMDKYSRYIVLISDALLEKYFRITNSDKLIRIYDGVSSLYDNYRLSHKKEKCFRAIIVGSIHTGKRQLESVRAVGELVKLGYNISLKLVGKCADCNYLSEINNYIKTNNLEEYIKYIGESNELNSLRGMSDVEIVSSYMEAFGRVTVEGMLSCLPVIASKSGANIELVKDDLNGYTYTLGDWKDMSNKIRYLYDNYDKRVELGLNGYKYASENFTCSVNCGNIYKLYNSIIK